MHITDSRHVTRTFSLCCASCDAGTECSTVEQAIAEGWSRVEEDFDGLSWNYLGECPDCSAETA